MTKTKKLFLIAAIFLFLSVFFVGVDNTAKASCASDCQSMATSEDGSFDDGLYGECYTSYDCYSVDKYSSCDPFTDPTCCGDSGGYWYNNTCNTDIEEQYYFDDYGVGDNSTSASYDGVVDNSNSNTSTCDPDPSCWWYNCCRNDVPAQTSAQTATDKAAANAAQTKALAATSVQNAATKIVNDKTIAMQQACSSGATQSADCIAAQKALDDAKKAYEIATEDAQAAIAEMDALSGTNYGSQSYGSTGNSIGGVSYGVNVGFGNVPGVSAGSAASCGVGFEKMGGVCFPTTTGLSSAPISTILSNLFLWLMGLFVTFAVVAFVVSGIQYLLAAGDEGMAETAKKNATNAIIGIIVGLSGFIIFKAIAAALSGQSYLF
ncbi:MAG TPA: hypothetical protein DEA43_02970 [Candidatus Moranbacteria bacterium]|nr:hypothetical protein [Candidatus Moranbacteria bacterium]HBT45817.1 hypothetical protein [Candidatus Moranbacteria bacterium]